MTDPTLKPPIAHIFEIREGQLPISTLTLRTHHPLIFQCGEDKELTMPKLNTILSQLLVGAFLLKSSAGFLPATTTQNSFKLTWELGVEECIRNSVENGLSEYESGEPYMVAVAGIPGSGKRYGAIRQSEAVLPASLSR